MAESRQRDRTEVADCVHLRCRPGMEPPEMLGRRRAVIQDRPVPSAANAAMRSTGPHNDEATQREPPKPKGSRVQIRTGRNRRPASVAGNLIPARHIGAPDSCRLSRTGGSSSGPTTTRCRLPAGTRGWRTASGMSVPCCSNRSSQEQPATAGRSRQPTRQPIHASCETPPEWPHVHSYLDDISARNGRPAPLFASDGPRRPPRCTAAATKRGYGA